jgi:para-aminobenzoate synthetase component 1
MNEKKFSPTDFEKLLISGSGFHNFCFLNSNSATPGSYAGLSKFDFLAGINTLDELETSQNSLAQLDEFIERNKSKWKFGFMSYDLKNELEPLKSRHLDKLNFPTLHFFVPQIVLISENGKLQMIDQQSGESEQFSTTEVELRQEPLSQQTKLTARFAKEDYLAAVNTLKHHIQQGNIYEVTFCQEFYNDQADIRPFEIYTKLNQASRAPMSCFYKSGERYVLSSSPERFIARRGNTLFSQPIKGTASRSQSREEDALLADQLLNSEKERAENTMIVDLVRNDLSRIAEEASVKVDEFLGLYSFKTVHQLISTIRCTIKDEIKFSEIINALFPMGSMTGAPKISAMKLIDETEKSRRSLFSGSVGYISPDGDFDFNVVIRSILYNAARKYLSVQAGGAITAQSNAELEFEESLLKAQAMMDVLK